jgi:hypothetical protein
MSNDIIRMAREAGIADAFLAQPHPGVMNQLERLAALFAAPLQERIQDLYKQLDEAERELDSQYKLGMEFEREECAKVCEEILEQYRGTDMGKHAELVGDDCATAIRARGGKSNAGLN